jgi:ribosome maturation factor RimP
MAILTENIREKLVEMFGIISEEEGLRIFDIKLAHRNATWDIKVTLDRLDGYVTVDDCARLSRRFAARLELERLLTGEYKLEVSSPGLDRPLRNRADYERFKGEKARLIIAGASGNEALTGRIVATDEDSVTLLVGENERIISYHAIKKANLEAEIPGFGGQKKKSRRKKKNRRKSG